jgi:hypothetical protein
MTKPNFVSSHDWHVQLCCQRSELFSPKRTALDQGLSIRHKPLHVSSNFMALVSSWLASADFHSTSGLDSARKSRSEAYDVLRELSKTIYFYLACQPLFRSSLRNFSQN